jgi:zinc transport system ATP-binding protein
LSKNILTLSNLTFGRNGQALYPQSPVDLAVSPSDLIAITGPSGAGKSTLLASLFNPEYRISGTLTWHTEDSGFGYMPQNANNEALLFPIVDVVALGNAKLGAFPSKTDREDASALLEQLGLGDLAYKRFGMLSGGEQQRVLFARAISLASESKVVLLDEPTSNLDASTKEFIHQQVDAFRKREYAFIAVTHDLNFAIESASQMVALTTGKASVLPASEIESSGVIDALLGGAL